MQQIGFFIAKNLLFAQHVSDTIMPIVRSSRVTQMVTACGNWCFGLQVVCLVWTHNPQLHTRPTTCKPKHQAPQAATICINLELLTIGIMVSETC